MENFYYNSLIDFIENNSNWQELLKQKPFNLKTVKQCSYNPNWWILVYNLFDSDLSNPVVKACRGSVVEVVNNKCKIVCAPYTKFFDIDDPHADAINWDSKKLSTQMKCDGQLIKCFKINGQVYWASNGSLEMGIEIDDSLFENFYGLLFNAIYQGDNSIYMNVKNNERFEVKSDNENSWINKMQEGWTYMFELTSPFNKIICKYDSVKLWFHGCRDDNGIEHDPQELDLPYEIPKRFNLNKKADILAALSKMDGNSEEGFVVCDMENWTRVKMKCPSYLALKFVRDNDTPKDIFKLVMSGEFDDLQNPDIQDKIQEQILELHRLQDLLLRTWTYAWKMQNDFFRGDRKDFAIWVKNNVDDFLQPFYFDAADNDFLICWDKLMSKFASPKGWKIYNNYLGLL